MSRSDHTIPFHVRVLEASKALQMHDHREGDCDLPDVEDWVRGVVTERTRCYWYLKTGDLYEHPTCGCAMCTDKFFRKQERRKARHTKDREIREQLAELDED